MADSRRLALSGHIAPKIQHTDARHGYQRMYRGHSRPNAPGITKIQETKLEIWPPAADGASPSLSRRLDPAHPRRAEHLKLVVADQRSDLRRVWRAGLVGSMRNLRLGGPEHSSMAILRHERVPCAEKLSSAKDELVSICSGLDLVDSIQLRRPVAAGFGAAAGDDAHATHLYCAMRCLDKQRRRLKPTPGKVSKAENLVTSCYVKASKSGTNQRGPRDAASARLGTVI